MYSPITPTAPHQAPPRRPHGPTRLAANPTTPTAPPSSKIRHRSSIDRHGTRLALPQSAMHATRTPRCHKHGRESRRKKVRPRLLEASTSVSKPSPLARSLFLHANAPLTLRGVALSCSAKESVTAPGRPRSMEVGTTEVGSRNRPVYSCTYSRLPAS